MRQLLNRITRHWRTPHSQHRKIAIGFLWVSGFVLIGKLAGAGKEMAIAWRYGISAEVDAYVFIFNLIGIPISIWFSVITVVLVPIIANLKNNSPGALSLFRSELLGLTVVIGCVFGLLAFFLVPVLLQAEWLGLSQEVVSRAHTMVRPMSWLIPLGIVISLFSVWLLADGQHRNTLFESIPALIILLVLLTPAGLVPEPLVWGTVAGFALHMAALTAPLYKQGTLQIPRISLHSPAWKHFWGSVGIMAIGQVLMSFTGIIDQFFAAGLGTGALSTLNYANRISALVLGLGAMAISRSVLPVFSEMHAKNTGNAVALARKWALWMGLLGIIILIVGWLSAHFVVETLFQRGAFTAQDTDTVASVLQWSLIQVPFYMSAITLVNLFASASQYTILMLSGALGLIIKAIACFTLLPWAGISGLVLSTAIVYLANILFLMFYVSDTVYEKR